jgi:hypothetical protein
MAKQFCVSYTSALSGIRNSSACKDKRAALREARQLFQEGARNIRVVQYDTESRIAIDINWK